MADDCSYYIFNIGLIGVILLITKSFIARVVLHIFLRILYIPLIIYIIRKCFKDQITKA